LVDTEHATAELVTVTVELFGHARILCGRREIDVRVSATARAADLAAALSEACPELVGRVIRDDGAGLQESYTFNVNGTAFVTDGGLQLEAGDSVLLFSSQAGG
jgi:molybdopterin converting factor small subunit